MVIQSLDYILLPVYFTIFYIFLFFYAKKHLKNKVERNYFILAFLLKAVSSILVGILYQYYYGYGDSLSYFRMGKLFLTAFYDNPASFKEIFFTGDSLFYNNIALNYNFSSWHNFNMASVVIARFTAFFQILTFKTYLPTALFFAFLSFSGSWALYKIFIQLYPELKKEMAYSILFVPSVVFWGSGLLKDTLSLSALGWLTFSAYKLFIIKKVNIKIIAVFSLSLLLLFAVKPYIAISYLPAFAIGLVIYYRSRINSNILRVIALPLFIFLLLLSFFIFSQVIEDKYSEFSFDNFINSATTLQNNINEYESGSAYNLGNLEFSSFMNKMLLIFKAINVTLFRPYIWESRKVIILLSALESFAILFYTLKILLNVGILRLIGTIFKQPIILHCLIFTLIFSFSVGLASGNFGTLVRYKIPCIPFYLIALTLINRYGKVNKLNFSTYRMPIRLT